MKNILKGIGVSVVLGIFGFYCVKSLPEPERNLDKNVVPQESHRRTIPESEGNSYDAEASERVYKALSGSGTSEADIYNENLDEYLEDPEDEITFPPEIYDAQID